MKPTPERPIVTLPQVIALAESIDARYRVIVLLSVFGCLRWGELMGLQRREVDLDVVKVSIERSMVEVGKRLVLKSPKTPAGVRTVALPMWLVGELRTHRDTYAEEGPEGRMFVGAKGATSFRGNFGTLWARAP